MDQESIDLATYWRIVRGFDLQTIAQHFGVSRDTLCKSMSRGVSPAYRSLVRDREAALSRPSQLIMEIAAA